MATETESSYQYSNELFNDYFFEHEIVEDWSGNYQSYQNGGYAPYETVSPCQVLPPSSAIIEYKPLKIPIIREESPQPTKITKKRSRSLDDILLSDEKRCRKCCKCSSEKIKFGDMLSSATGSQGKISGESLSNFKFNQMISIQPDDLSYDELKFKTDYYQIMDMKKPSKRDAGEVDLIRLYVSLKLGEGKSVPEIHDDLYKILKIKSDPKPDLTAAKSKKLMRNNLNYKIKNLTTIYPHLAFYYTDLKDWNLPNLRKVPEVLLYYNNEELRKKYQENIASSKNNNRHRSPDSDSSE